MDNLIKTILDTTKADEYIVCLSDSRTNTFRYKICPEYKAHRPQEKPLHYDALKQYLIDEWGAVVAVEEEADDLMGIEQEGDSTVICSIDKDMLQVPGHHYNFVKDSFTFVSPEEGRLFFYKQLLMGDKADNIQGIRGLGPVNAGRLLDHTLDYPETEQFEIVKNRYKEFLQEQWEVFDDEWDDFHEKQLHNILLVNGILLKIRQKKGEIWQFPDGLKLKPETEPQLESTQSLVEAE